MSLNVGQLLATFNVDPRPAVAGITRAEAMMHGLAADAEVTGRRIRAGLDEALQELPPVTITADSSEADREIEALRQRLAVLRDSHISVDLTTEEAQREIADVRARLTQLAVASPVIQVSADIRDATRALDTVLGDATAVAGTDPAVRVHADTAAAERELARVAAEAEAVDRIDPRIDVHADDSEARGLIGTLGSLFGVVSGGIGSLGGLASAVALVGAGVPIVAGLVATLANIAPAAAIGATAVLSVAGAVAAIKIGTGGIGGAFKAAFAPAVSGGGAAAGAANHAADAQRNLQRATQQAAYANEQAVQQTAHAERDLADAQRAALAAQRAVNDARKQAARDLEDQNNQLIDAQNATADATNALADARAQYEQDAAQGAGAGQLDRDNLAIREAEQALAEQQLQVRRLQDDTAAANKAGVNGSKAVTDAQNNAAKATRDVGDKEQALANAREQQARTAQQGLDAIRQAQEAMAQSAGGGGAAGGVNALDAAMAKLAPNARAFVREIISLRPAWDALRLDVQQRLFAGLAAAVAATAAVVLPQLRHSLTDTAGALNGMAVGVLAAARDLGTSGTLGRALDGAAAGLHNLVRIPGQVVTAFGQIAAAGAPAFGRLTAAAGSAFDKISKRLTESFASGGMSRAIDTAVHLSKELGQIGGNVFSVLGSIMGAAQATGGGFLGVLRNITGALAGAFKSDAVQGALRALFATMALIGRTAAPLVVSALKIIAPVLSALAPPAQRLVQALGKALSPIISALGPVLLAAAVAVGQLADAVGPLLPIVGQMIASLGPVLTPILHLVGSLFAALAPPLVELGRVLLPPLVKLTGTLVDVFHRAAPVLDRAMSQLGTGLVPVIDGLGKVVSEFVTQYADDFLAAFVQLIPIIPQLVPMFLQLATSAGQILTAIAPLLPQLMLLSTQFLLQLLPAIIPLIPPLTRLSTGLAILATAVITRVVIPALKLLINFISDLRRMFQPGIDAVHWFTTTVSRVFEWLADHLVGHSVIPDMVRSIVAWLGRLPGMAASALASLPRRIGGAAENAAGRLISAIRQGLSNAVAWLGGLPGRAEHAIGDLSGLLWKSGQALINGFIGGITSMGDLVGNAASSIVGKARDYFPFSPARKGPFSGRGWVRYSGEALGAAFASGMSSQEDAVGAAAASLMGTAAGGIGGPGVAVQSRAMAGYGSGGGSAGGGRVDLRITVDGPEAVKKLIRTIVKNDGRGDVQVAFGR